MGLGIRRRRRRAGGTTDLTGKGHHHADQHAGEDDRADARRIDASCDNPLDAHADRGKQNDDVKGAALYRNATYAPERGAAAEKDEFEQ